MVGKTFGDMRVIEKVESVNTRQYTYLVECLVCGRQKHSRGQVVRKLVGMSHKSCGKGLKTKDKRFYGIWQNVKTRCNNPNFHAFSAYMGKGVKCDEFNNFIDFYDKMYKSYRAHVEEYGESETTLDRIDVNGDYSVKNCRWATWEEQFDNLSKQKHIVAVSPTGEIIKFNNINKFASMNDIHGSTIKDYLRGKLKSAKGWHFELV